MIFRYNNQALYNSLGDSASVQDINIGQGSVNQISRVQDISLDISIPYYQGTSLENNVIMDNISTSIATLGFNFLPSALTNYQRFALFSFSGGGALDNNLKLNEERNYYIRFNQDRDLVGNSSLTDNVIGLGNGVITSFSLGGSVNNLLKSHMELEFLEVKSYTGVSGQMTPNFRHDTQQFDTGNFFYLQPAIAQNGAGIAALKSNDISLNFSTGDCFALSLTGDNSCYLQSFNIAVNINRTAVLELGKKYPTIRPVIFPIEVNVQTEAIVSHLSEDQISSYFCDGRTYDISITANTRTCSGVSDSIPLTVDIKDLKLERQSFNSSLNGPLTVSLSWKTLIGNYSDMNRRLSFY